MISGGVDGIKKIAGGVTTAKGFKTISTAAGIRYRNRKDVALIYSEASCKSAGAFASNIVEAAPVKWGRNQVTDNVPTRTVIVNAGIASACTGKESMEYCSQTADTAAAVLDIPAENVLVASTGVIGKQLPMGEIRAGIKAIAPLLDGGADSGTEASKAITTTDTKNKGVAVQFELSGAIVTMGGMCRGSGMIHPSVCTMLSFMTTDAAVSKKMLQETLSEDIKDTYNIISVDSDISTNDTVFLLASGLAGSEEIREKSSDCQVPCKALNYINETLTKKMARDGGGYMTLFEVTIVDARTKNQAKVLVKSAITSSLTKAAIFGHDTNWGRILCAIGYSRAGFGPGGVDLFFKSATGEIQIIKGGVAVDYSEEQTTEMLSQPQATAMADTRMGNAQTTARGCDLTLDYVKINADYRS